MTIADLGIQLKREGMQEIFLFSKFCSPLLFSLLHEHVLAKFLPRYQYLTDRSVLPSNLFSMNVTFSCLSCFCLRGSSWFFVSSCLCFFLIL
jgi:hypothetical protein